MAMMASKGPEEALEVPLWFMLSAVRSVVEEPRRSPAPREEEVVDWIWEAEKSLHEKLRVSCVVNGEVGRGEGLVERRERAYLEHAIGSSQDPGTDCTMMFDSLTPDERSLAFVPARSGSIMALRECD